MIINPKDNLQNSNCCLLSKLPFEIKQYIISYLYPIQKNIILINTFFYHKFKTIITIYSIHNQINFNKICISSIPSLSPNDFGLKIKCNQNRKLGSVFCTICGYLYHKNF